MLKTNMGSSAKESITEDLSEKYVIVEFKKRGPQAKRIVEVVLCKWIRFDQTKKKFMTKFLESSSANDEYTDDDRKLIEGLLTAKCDAPESWLEYICYVRGVSDTIEEAEKKIDRLNDKENAFSTDSDMDSNQKAEEFVELMKRQALKNQEVDIFSAVSVSPKSDDVDDKVNRKKKKKSSKKRKIYDSSEPDDYEGKEPSKLLKLQGAGNQSKTESDCTGGCNCCQKLKLHLKDNDVKSVLTYMNKRLNNLHDIIIANFTTLAAQLNELKGSCQVQKSNVHAKIVDFSAKYGVSLPCGNNESIDNLNSILAAENCSNDLKTIIISSINRLAGVGKTTSSILRLLLTRDMAMKCTAQKVVPEKYLIKDMKFTKLIADVLMEETNISTQKMALKTIGDALGNAKDWDGHRVLRLKTQQPLKE